MVAQPGIPGIPGSSQPSMGHAGTSGPPGVTSLIATPQPYSYHPVSGQAVGSIAPSTSSQPMAQYTVAANTLPAGAYHVNAHVQGQQASGQYVTASQEVHLQQLRLMFHLHNKLHMHKEVTVQVIKLQQQLLRKHPDRNHLEQIQYTLDLQRPHSHMICCPIAWFQFKCKFHQDNSLILS